MTTFKCGQCDTMRVEGSELWWPIPKGANNGVAITVALCSECYKNLLTLVPPETSRFITMYCVKKPKKGGLYTVGNSYVATIRPDGHPCIHDDAGNYVDLFVDGQLEKCWSDQPKEKRARKKI